MRTLLILTIAFIVFGGTTFAQKGLGGKRWQLVELNGEKPKNPRAYIEFNEGEKKISGSGGCNRFFGSYETGDGTFKIKGVGATKMMCMRPGTMETEDALFKALNNAAKMTVIRGDLRIYDASEVVIATFRADQKFTAEPIDLTSRKWMLRTIGETELTLEKNAPFISFDSKKKSVGGNSGCNSFGGGYETAGAKIKFGNMISTMMACEAENRMSIEHGFLAGLGEANRYEIRGEVLYLYKDDVELLSFAGAAK